MWARVLVGIVLLLIIVPTAEAIANCCVGGFFSLAIMELIACAVCLALAIGLCRLTSRLYAAHEQDERRLSQLQAAESALRASMAQFRVLSQLAPVGIFQTDEHGSNIFVNDEYLRLTGLSPEDGAQNGWMKAIHPDDRSRVYALWDRAFAAQTDFSGEYRYRRPDGETVWISGLATPMRDESGRMTGYLGAVANITALKAAEARLRESLAQQQSLARREQTLRRELDHRVRNNLAGLLGLIRLYRRSGDPRASLTQIEGKVRAIREVHELLAAPTTPESDRGGHVDLGTLVQRLGSLVVEPGAASQIRLPAHVPDGAFDDHQRIWIPAAQAAPLAMIVHELLTNSLKHGALAPTIGGHICVDWHAPASGQGFTVIWREHCVRPIAPSPLPGSEGLGLGLIRGFARSELAGDCEFDFTPSGLRFELRAGIRISPPAAPVVINAIDAAAPVLAGSGSTRSFE